MTNSSNIIIVANGGGGTYLVHNILLYINYLIRNIYVKGARNTKK